MKFVLLAIGILLLIWYLAPTFSNIFNVANMVGIMISTFFVAFSLRYDVIPSKIRIAILILILVLCVIVLVPISINMIKYANYKSKNGSNTVVVLGCKVNEDKPSKFLYNRCKVAYDYLSENENSVAILSGGQGADEGISEALCMKNVLTQMGVDENRLIMEDKSTTTEENLEFSKEIIKNENLDDNILVVTNEFHEYRAKLICDKIGLNFHSKCSHSSFYTFLTFYTREIFAIIKQVFINK